MSSRVTDQPAFILRRREWRNSSLLLDLFSRDHGCLRVMAKGARRASLQANYQPFVMLAVNWSGRQELKTLTGVEGQALPVDEKNYLALLYINELIGALLPPGEAAPELFAAYLGLLQQSVLRLEEATLRSFERILLQQLGYLPDLSTDARSGEPVDAQQHYQFIVDSGFVACAGEAPDSVAGETLIDWLRGDYDKAEVIRIARLVLRSTIDFNLHGKTLKSRDVYAEIMRRR